MNIYVNVYIVLSREGALTAKIAVKAYKVDVKNSCNLRFYKQMQIARMKRLL